MPVSMSDPLRRSLIQRGQEPFLGVILGDHGDGHSPGLPPARTRAPRAGGAPGTPDVRRDVPFAALGPRPREGGPPSRSGRKAAGRPPRGAAGWARPAREG